MTTIFPLDCAVITVCILNTVLALYNNNIHSTGGWLVATLGWLKIIFSSIMLGTNL